MNVKFQGWYCKVIRRTYTNGRNALLLIDAESREPVAVATVNLPDHDPGHNNVLIKDWSENEGMYDALLEAGIIKETIAEAGSGFVMVKE